VGCDQATKLIARDHLTPGKPLIYAGDLFRLQYAENKGAFLGLGSSLPDAAREAIFTGGAGLMLIFMLVWLLRARRMSPWNTLAVALFCGGGLGNLIDRIFRDGRVIDFLNVGIGGLRSGIFNVADMAITAGIIMLFLGEAPFRRFRRSAPDGVSTT
jgi:signal peptidase II